MNDYADATDNEADTPSRSTGDRIMSFPLGHLEKATGGITL